MDAHPEADPIVVGVDGSAEALAAVDLAASEAVWHGRPLQIAHGFIWPYMRVPLGPSEVGPPEGGLRNQAERIVAEAVARARAAAPQARVTGEVVTGSGAKVLIDSSRTAAMVVVGDRGLGAVSSLLLGSVATQVATHAFCPILVSRGATDASLPVLVAVDGSPANAPAVKFAFAEAALRGAPLTALHVWPRPAAEPGERQPGAYEETPAQNETRVLAEALADLRSQYPDLEVRWQVAHGRVRKTVVNATRDAQLVVMGARGHGGFAGLLLGSVSHATLRHSACPTVIVPHDRVPR